MTRATTSLLAALAALALACGDDAPGAPRSHARARDAASETSAPDTGLQPTAAERGEYLVKAVAACGLCHTPRQPDGSFDESKWLSGVECLTDVYPRDPARGCIHSRNLTAHETGLQNRSDDDILDMFRKGERPDGKPVHPFMPYWALGNMRDEDARAIVAYLRNVPGIDHMLPPSESPFRSPEQPAPRWPAERIPKPSAEYPDQVAALRGRYLAAEVGVCMACHTPRGEDGLPVYERAFQGGGLLEMAGFVWATPAIAGRGAGSIDELASRIRTAHGAALCPDSSGVSAFAGLKEVDALDIAHYLASLVGEGAEASRCEADAGL